MDQVRDRWWFVGWDGQWPIDKRNADRGFVARKPAEEGPPFKDQPAVFGTAGGKIKVGRSQAWGRTLRLPSVGL